MPSYFDRLRLKQEEKKTPAQAAAAVATSATVQPASQRSVLSVQQQTADIPASQPPSSLQHQASLFGRHYSKQSTVKKADGDAHSRKVTAPSISPIPIPPLDAVVKPHRPLLPESSLRSVSSSDSLNIFSTPPTSKDAPRDPQFTAVKRTAIQSAVSLKFLLDFASMLKRDKSDGMTTEQIMQRYVIPPTATHRTRYVDSGLVPDDHVGNPTFFVSHKWGNTFQLMVDAIQQQLSGAVPAQVFLWIDIFAVNQHPGVDQAEDLNNLEAAIAVSSGTLVIMDSQGGPLMRVWCLLEIWSTLRSKGREALHLLNPGFDLKNVMIDIRQASVTNPEDKVKILQRIGGVDGAGIDELNLHLKLLFLLDPMDFKAETLQMLENTQMGSEQARKHQRTQRLHLDKYRSWLELAQEHKHYGCFAIYGSAGSGKSTISAALIHSELRPHAWHFCKHNDRRRADPVRMFKTLIYQLAFSIPVLQGWLLSHLETHGAHQFVQVDHAFNVLLKRPLEHLGDINKVPDNGIVILLDALDEADGKLGAFDNHILLALREMFPRLPKFCRFVVTSRPESEYPHILRVLEYEFNPMQARPAELREEQDLKNVLAVALGEMMDKTSQLTEAVNQLLTKSQGSLVYCTVVIHDMEGQGETRGTASNPRPKWTLSEIQALPNGLYEAYVACFRRALSKCCQLDKQRTMELLQVLVAAREPLTLNQLQSLGKKDHLVLLPGWGWLFYEKDYQVHAMHKSIFDWLRNKDAAGEFFVDAVLGHVAIADLVCRDVRSSKHPQNYSVKYAVAHLCMAGDTTALEKLVLDFHFWQRAYTVGCGVDVFRDLLELAPSGSAAAQDVLRWLSDVSEFLMKHPQATIQLAQDAPTESLTSKAGVFLNWRRGAVLLNKDQGWPSCLTALRGHAMLVSSTAFSPTGNLVASSSYDGSVRLWDPRTGQQVTALIGHMGEVTDVVISPDGMKVVTVGRDYTARYWDIKTGHQMEVWGLPVASAAAVGDDLGVTCLQLTVSPDCSTVASLLSDRTVRLWDIRTSKQLSMREGHSVVAFSPDGVALATGSSDTDVLVWEAKTRRHLAVLKCETPVTAVTLGQACRYAATGSPRGDVLLWDVRAGGVKMASLQGHSSQVSSLALSPDGNLLASGAKDRTVLLWEARTGQRVDTVLHGHSGPVSCLCFSPDSKLLTSGSADSTVRLWDAAIAAGTAARKISTGVPTLARRASLIMANASDAASKTAPVYVRSATFSPNGGSLLLIVSLDKSAQIWDTKTATCICRLDGSTQSTGRYQFSPDGSLVLAPLMPQITLLDELEEAWIWDTKTGRLMAQLQGKQPTFSPHSSMVACVIPAGTDGKLSAVRICEARSGDQVSILEGHTPSFSPDGARIATVASAASVEGDSIRLWNTDKFEELAVIHGRGPVVWSSDGALLALKYKNTTVLRGSNKGQRIGDLRGLMPQGGQPFFSPDSSRCVTLDSDWTVYIWDSYQGTQIVAVKRSVPSHITFSHDGMRAVISSCERPGSVRAGSNSSSALPAAPGSPKSVSSPHRSMSIFNHSNSLSLHASNSFHGGVLSSSSFLNASLGASLGGSLSVEGTRGASFVGSGHISLAALLNAQHAARKEPDNEVQLWDTESGNLLAKFETTGFAFSPDGTLLAAAVCPSNQNGRSSFSGHSFMLPNRLGAGPGSGSSLQASSSMQLPDAAPTPAVSKVVMYDARTGRQTLQLASIPNMGPCQRLRFSEDGMYLAGVSDDQLVAVWNSQLGTEVKWSGSASSCSIADWSPPYFVAVGGDTEVIKLMNASKPWTWDDATAIFSTTPVGKVVIQGCMAVTAGSTTQTPPGSALQDLALYDNVHMWRINTTGS